MVKSKSYDMADMLKFCKFDFQNFATSTEAGSHMKFLLVKFCMYYSGPSV